MLYKMTEWQGGSGLWYCNDVTRLGTGGGVWYEAASALNISPVDYVKILVERFHPDSIYWNQERNFLSFAWKKQADMRKFKNWVNAESRKVNKQF